MKQYPLADELVRPGLGVAMPWMPRLHGPVGTVRVVARCNNREFYIATADDFEQVLATLRGMIRTYDVTLC